MRKERKFKSNRTGGIKSNRYVGFTSELILRVTIWNKSKYDFTPSMAPIFGIQENSLKVMGETTFKRESG